MTHFTAAAAARELGVTRATLYAYVSRGLIRSERGQGRARRYDADDIARLKRGEGAVSLSTLDSAITQVVSGRVYFRGRDAESIAHNLSVREAAAFLWQCDPATSFAAGNVPDPLPGYAGLAAALAFLPPAGRALALLHAAAAEEPLLPDNSAAAWGYAGARLLRFLAGAAAGLAPSARPVEAVLAEAWGLPRDRRPALRAAIIRSCDAGLDGAALATRAAVAAGAPPWHTVAAGLITLPPHTVAQDMPARLPRGCDAALALLGRTIGLVAHAAEERAASRKLRPRQRYVGPPPEPPRKP
jgi:citrate synthase